MFTEIRFRDFRQQYPGFLPGILVVLVMLVAIDLLLVQRRANYERQIVELRAGMTDNQRERGDALAEARGQQEKLKLELVRREAKFGKALHLSLDVDSSRLALVQEGAVLRDFPVRLGVERSLGRGDTVVSSVKRALPFSRATLRTRTARSQAPGRESPGLSATTSLRMLTAASTWPWVR